ncbi:hypothetical protein KJ359_004704 [Pestalotiopsis sp. 9143b]|nr:hypothetical protein KJ359_004704 [Pestalotiopsis sp. 9143b]
MCPPSSASKSAPSKATTGTSKGTRKPLADKADLSPVAATKRPRRAAKDKTNATSASEKYFSQDLNDLLDSDDQDLRPKTSRDRLDTSKKSNKKRDSEPAFNGPKNAIDVASVEDNDGDHVVQTATSLRNTQVVSTAPPDDDDLATEDYDVHDEAAKANVDKACLVSDHDIMLDNYDEPDDNSEFEDDFEPDDDFECLLNELFVSDESDTEGDDELDDPCLSESDSDTGGNAHGKRLATSKSKEPEIKRQRLSPAQTVAKVVAKINEQIPVAVDDPDVVPESIFTTPAISRANEPWFSLR